MIKTTVEPACTGQFSALFLDYIHEKETLNPFYNFYPKLENFGRAIKERRFSPEYREVLVEALEKQYAHLETHESVLANIHALGQEKTFTVTTGHQLNLFTGPLYFIYKIVSTINLAKKLKKAYPEYHFVPVYWMATEDHDFEEINHFTYEGNRYAWHTDQKGAVGDFSLDGHLKELIQSLSFAPEFFKKAYLKHEKLSGAVRCYVEHLFGEYGLVVVDGHEKALKQLFVPLIKDDLLNHTANTLVNDQTEKLAKMGYESQIFPREINFFYLDNGIRERIVKKGNQFEVLNTDISWTESEILEILEGEPERFSPNVVMRPLYQEVILPNLAYLGGPAEVGYWLQLKQVFDHYQVDFPAIMPRNFAVLLDPVCQRKMAQLNLDDRDLFRDYTDWKREFVRSRSKIDLDLKAESKDLEKVFESISEKGASLNGSLSEASKAAKVRALKILSQMAVKLRKAEEKNFETDLNRMRAIKEKLYPKGNPQERVENFLSFYLQDPAFIKGLLDLFDPLDFEFNVLRLDQADGI